ncbi:54S ribosomal protein L3 mitochondrial [Malassezia vespertilionis]|uniref:Large ribosomal subunit protein mL44 n=1 Tax=Malassezia vespertilionis TaxID=2020962 RepID=A0A2N1JE83_9BASI|nr:54S ribosomal protein L3 mitochondrial [Malassezia vespertilionis]PKI84867.1 hypothetical protein MVES_000801 [Malassezia vespertilionis]WFD05524.1 54S ribosomal protein L3 mitochondrial [Malassezia vespertilionis]
MARTYPKIWASLRDQAPSAIAALGARFHLFPNSLSMEERASREALVRIACTHPSVVSVQRQVADLSLSVDERSEVPQLSEVIAHNAALATMGNALLGLVAAEYFHLKYPHLPTRLLKAFVSAYVGPSTLADVGADLGILAQGVQRWDRTGASVIAHEIKGARAPKRMPLLSKDVAAQSMRAMIAVLFQELGMAAMRTFVHSYFFSRRMDLASLIKFRDPKRVLSATCKKYSKPLPESRIIAETGRLSISPVFVVGVWSGKVKLGEGSGSSIRMAEFRAAENALRRLYLAEKPDNAFQLPSSTLDAAFCGTTPLPHSLQLSAQTNAPNAFSPQPLGHAEVLHESRG